MEWLQKQKNTICILAIGITWLVYAIIGEFRRPIHFVLCAALSLCVFFVLRKLLGSLAQEEEPAPVQKAKQEPHDPLQERGNEFLRKLQELDEKIPDIVVSAKLKQISCLMEQILGVVKKQPEKSKDIRLLMDYYLPTTIKLLEQYAILQEQKIKGENIGDAMQKIEGLLDSVIVALEKQHDGLFEMDVVDITAEIRAMENKMASEGLTVNDDFKEIL